jgi:hypothetical protein
MVRRSWAPHGGTLVALSAALGLVACAVGEDLSRAGQLPTPFIVWLGFALIFVPVVYRVTAPTTGWREQLALAGLCTLADYLVKYMRSPFGFTITDEYSHLTNLENVLRTHHLFTPNLLLPITAHFPGLEGAASAVAMLAGISPFVARLTATFALVALFSGVSRSSRVGALGAIMFMANSNNLLFENAFAYESLALPLLFVLLAALAARQRSVRAAEARSWLIVAIVMVLAVVPTHHMTSYVMIVVLSILSLRRVPLPRPLRSLVFPDRYANWPLALLAGAATIAWLLVVASQVVGYVYPVVSAAFTSTIHTFLGEAPPHAPFSGGRAFGGGAAINTPVEEGIALLEPLLLLVAASLGLRRAWRGSRSERLLALLGLFALGYFAATAARIFPATWQVANRSAEFFFVGLAYTVGAMCLGYDRSLWRRRLGRLAVATAAWLCIVGGVISGWPAQSRIAQPTQVLVNGRTMYSEQISLARWAASAPRGLFAALQADAQVITVLGHRRVITGQDQGYPAAVQPDLTSVTWTPQEAALFRRQHVRYVVVDRSPAALDVVAGMYFQLTPPIGESVRLGAPAMITKLDPVAARVYDSGNLAVFDLDTKP